MNPSKTYLRQEMRKYLSTVPDASPEEIADLKKWAAQGNDPYGNPCAHWFEDIHDWAGLKSFVMVQRTRQIKGVTSTEKAYYISSLEADAKSFAQWTRGHWGIENTLHWVMDVQFHEDACTIHKGNSPENLSILRKMAKNLLGRVKTKADSFRRLQLRAGWDNDFLFHIIT